MQDIRICGTRTALPKHSEPMTFVHAKNYRELHPAAASHLRQPPTYPSHIKSHRRLSRVPCKLAVLTNSAAVPRHNHSHASQVHDRKGPYHPRAQLCLQRHFNFYQQGEQEYCHCCRTIRCKIAPSEVGQDIRGSLEMRLRE